MQHSYAKAKNYDISCKCVRDEEVVVFFLLCESSYKHRGRSQGWRGVEGESGPAGRWKVEPTNEHATGRYPPRPRSHATMSTTRW